MSAIGDYIHATSQGYLDWGINRPGTTPNHSWSSPSQMLESKALSKRASVDLSDVEKEISSLLVVNPTEGTNASAVQEEVKKQLIEMFQEQMGNIDFENLTVAHNKETLENAMGRIHVTGKGDDKTFKVSLKTMTDRVIKLEKIVESIINNDDGISPDKAKELKADIQEMKTLYKNIYKSTAKQISNYGYKMAHGETQPDTADMGKLRNVMNRLIKEYAAMPAIPLQEGTLWEMILAASRYSAGKAGSLSLQETMKEAILGDQYVKTSFNFGNFSDNESVQKMLKDTVKVDIDESGATGRRKVDVTLNWDGEELQISAKNIKVDTSSNGYIYGWATVVSGSPMLTMIQNMDAEFVNHYLNTFSKHHILQKNGSFKEEKKLDNEKLANEMKLSLFYVGLTGDNYEREIDTANVFAINDKNGRGIKLVYMDDIIKRVSKATNFISVKIKGMSSGEEVSLKDYRFKNTPVLGDPQARIANVIAEMHAAKIHASFNAGSVLYK